jgi:predicted nucleic acid-binding protein
MSVINTTTLIALSYVGQLDILKKMYGEILIPNAVYIYIKREYLLF